MTVTNTNESGPASSCPEPNTTLSSIPQHSMIQPSHSRPPVHSNLFGEDEFIDLESDDTGAQSRKPRKLKL